MELQHRILQFKNSPKFNLLEAELQKLGCDYQFNENGALSSIEFTFSDHERYAPRLVEFASATGLLIDSTLCYEEEEISQAEWVLAGVGEYQYPQPEDGYIEATYDTSDYCRRCGQGARQDRPFRLKKDFVQKQAKFLGLHWVFDEIFIRPVVMSIFDTAGISGLTYREVLHHQTGQPIQDLLQVNIPIIEQSGLITGDLSPVTCTPQNEESHVKGLGGAKDKAVMPFCGRVKYHYPKTKPVEFKESILKDQPDVVKSLEYYGSGAAAHHFLLFRSKVMRLVKEKGLRGLEFQRPVHLV